MSMQCEIPLPEASPSLVLAGGISFPPPRTLDAHPLPQLTNKDVTDHVSQRSGGHVRGDIAGPNAR
jgi:hypothetical protein